MSKRFTDTEKWKRPWFRNLPAPYREFWIYILDNCDLAGFWYVDYELASFILGQKIDSLQAKNLFKKQIVVMTDDSKETPASEKWFIPDFLKFQYGELKPNNNLHRAVLSILDKNKPTLISAPGQGLISPSRGAQVMVMVKDKVISKKDIATEEPKEDKKLTDLQKVITVYKLSCGFSQDDKQWDKTFFGRYAKSAKAIIEFMGNWKDAADCVQDTVEKIRAWNPEATISLDTVLNKHAAEFKKNLQEKVEKNGIHY